MITKDHDYYTHGRKRLFVKITRLMNYICVLGMIIDSILRLVFFVSGDPSLYNYPFYYLLTFYLLGFATLLFLVEMRYSKVLVQVEFLRGRLGKGIFLILIGILVFNNTRNVSTLLYNF